MAQIGESERALQNRVIAFFKQKLNYAYLGNLQDKANTNIMPELLKNFLTNSMGYSEYLADKAIEKLSETAAECPSADKLYNANKKVYTLLKYGIKVNDENGIPKTVYPVNWETPEINQFAIAEEVTVLHHCEKRPDLVVYVNGIALSVIELKKSTISVSNGIRQNLTNQREGFIYPFFTTVQIVAAGNDSEGVRYGVINTPEKYFLEWKNDDQTSDTKAKEINNVCTLLKDNKLEWQIYGIYEKMRFLDIIHNFLIFDKGEKKICRHNQYFGILEAQQKISKREGGIIWHTQGSGKSLTMVWLSKWILSHYSDARVLIITDRDELDEQIEKTYGGVDETIYRTKSCKDLIEKLGAHDERLLCSLVHKFGHRNANGIKTDNYDAYIEEIKKALPKNFSAKGDIFVFVDECHRTQSGKLHKAMKEILPNSVFIGFTGTPLLREDKKKSKEIFGEYIHTYKYHEAVTDNVVLDLRYEARDIPQEVTNQEKIDEWFEAKTRGLMPRAKAKLKQLWGNLQTLYSSKTRLEKIACDIIFDFNTKSRLENGNGNALLVADSIYSACKYYEIFISKGFSKCAIITSFDSSPQALRTETTGADENNDTWEKYETYQKMLNGQDRDVFEKEVKRKFVEEPANMKLLIVVDKLLTGFDAPPCTYLYIDKAMKDHGLFQAICRVNRLHDESKDFGYVVDYKQLFENLSNAVNQYAGASNFDAYDEEDIEGLIKDRIEEAKACFEKTLDEIDALCEGVKHPKGELEYSQYFCGENGIDVGKDEIFARMREKLYKLSSRLTRAYAELKPDMTEAGYTHEKQIELEKSVKFYVDLRDYIGRASGDFIDFKAYQPGMRFLIDNYIIAEDSQSIGKFDDFTVLDFILEQGEKLKNDNDNASQEAAAEAIENNIRRKIVERQIVNPLYYEKMSAILQRLINDRKNGVIAYKSLLDKYIDLLKKAEKPEENEYFPLSVRHSAAKRAFYTQFSENAELANELYNAVMNSKQDDFRGNIVKIRRIKKALYTVLNNDSEVEKVYELVNVQKEF
ncbi:MAG: HsdR family type I site-specific deoxyribonuclease [Bacteroidetes bacterium]|nr:HsdR family type I site-specific deoxyribonuclease [Bacteroidota bacterium]MCL1969548.1 HsdR family type I site-specific deoxyribonuclease [Bacteroidota bacterium]